MAVLKLPDNQNSVWAVEKRADVLVPSQLNEPHKILSLQFDAFFVLTFMDGAEHRRHRQWRRPSDLDAGNAMRWMMMKDVIKALPENVQHRVNAFKQLQKKYLKLEAKFFEEVYALECKYQELYQPLGRRKAGITGAGSRSWVRPTGRKSPRTRLTPK
ncbi:hypothetical protein pipiens_016805 [Culex pipiens pipiens]|uniref:MADF domain-containing protein n=1 Tax=Culex pipiens pipiens TaxID=38569 RepID=A0ABD1CJS3_CULPP